MTVCILILSVDIGTEPPTQFAEFENPVASNYVLECISFATPLFVSRDENIVEYLGKEYPFYIWDESINEVRWMCSFDTTEEDISSFVNSLSKALSSAY